ncbi:DNA polymerase III subunit delta [Candidatus Uhrbacteria bacterium]|nr:DNA polymerase III subunit delta [Candidatus Uhrbacteria bacterium]
MIIFLHGNDTYRSRAKLHELTGKFRREVDPSGSNLVVLDGTAITASEFWGAVAAQSFLVRKRMIVVEDVGIPKSTAVRAEVAALLDRIPEEAIVIFYESRNAAEQKKERTKTRAKPGAAPRKSKKKKVEDTIPERADTLMAQLLAGKFAYEFAPLEGAALAAWVRERIAAAGVTIDPAALRALITEVGGDGWRMVQEIAKLAAAALAQGAAPEIRAALVQDLVATAPTSDVFGFLDAIGRGDRATALEKLRDLERTGTDPHYLVVMLTRQLRQLVMAADLLDAGAPPAQLAAALRVPPFVAQKIAMQVRGASLPRLRSLYPHLLELDRTLKSSRAPWEALLTLFVCDATER